MKELNLEDKINQESESNDYDTSDDDDYVKDLWLDPLKELQINNGKDESGEIAIKNEVFIDAMIDLVSCISNKSGDLKTFLMNWCGKI